ncbi:MAG TPA: ferrous iron transport protein B [Sphaerochaeta sp.]|nr:ferrous iron transport protein B [Sphaerochaeta sp.]
MSNKRVALVGNPNSGKTTLFNEITGSTQHVGNWPGVTVEKKEGHYTYGGETYDVIDLPGIYSLGAFSEDEVVAMEYILTDDADVIINVIDASNVERNLYLTTQLLEMGKNVIIALNMVDEAKKRAISFDLEKLSRAIGVPVIATVASKGVGVAEILKASAKAAKQKRSYENPLTYTESVTHHVEHIETIIGESELPYPTPWAAIKIVEGDSHVLGRIEQAGIDEQLLAGIQDFHKFHSSDNFELEIVDSRYAFAHRVAKEAVQRPAQEKATLTDRIDRILINKYLGIPIFALIMFAVFQLTFVIGEDLLGGLAVSLIEGLGSLLERFLLFVSAPSWLVAFMIDGVVNGVGAVVEFVPLITVLYLLLSLLEDSGYMARAAYVWDNLMRRFGMQGKAFISMIIGFGCTVPAIMSTRTMDNKKDRMVTMLITPFMSCGAKLPIYSVFIAAFFPRHGGLVLFGLYTFGILIGLLMAKLFNSTIFKGESSYFIMELPPYRIPATKSVLQNMWLQVSDFIVRAGTIIFLVITIMWLMAVLPGSVEPYSQESYLGKLGTLLIPIFRPAGFGTWQEAVALFAGIPAKEAVVGTLGMLYAGQYLEEGAILVNAVKQNFTALTAMAYMVMVLLYTPCAATLGIVAKETKSLRWPIIMALYTFAIGWLFAVLIFQIGTLFGLG